MTEDKLEAAKFMVADIQSCLATDYDLMHTHQYNYYFLHRVTKPSTKDMPAFVDLVGFRLNFHELVMIWLSPIEDLAKKLSSINEAENILIKFRMMRGT
jgi:hypothetical protein